VAPLSVLSQRGEALNTLLLGVETFRIALITLTDCFDLTELLNRLAPIKKGSFRNPYLYPFSI
jgi:hypothetical protein